MQNKASRQPPTIAFFAGHRADFVIKVRPPTYCTSYQQLPMPQLPTFWAPVPSAAKLKTPSQLPRLAPRPCSVVLPQRRTLLPTSRPTPRPRAEVGLFLCPLLFWLGPWPRLSPWPCGQPPNLLSARHPKEKAGWHMGTELLARRCSSAAMLRSRRGPHCVNSASGYRPPNGNL